MNVILVPFLIWFLCTLQSYQCDYKQRMEEDKLRRQQRDQLELEQERQQQEQRLRQQQRLQQQQQNEHRGEVLSQSVVNYDHSRPRAPPPPPSISGFRTSTYKPSTYVPASSRGIAPQRSTSPIRGIAAPQRSTSPDIMRYMNPETPRYQVMLPLQHYIKIEGVNLIKL